jgi:MarR family transcriptional regulator for hemolysin
LEPLPDNAYHPPFGKVFGELAKAYANHFTERLRDLPLQRYYYSLVVIEAYGGNINQTALGEELYLDKASVVRMLDYLEDEDCIRRVQNPQDRRAHLLELSPKALAMLPEIKEALQETNALCIKEVEALGITNFEAALAQIHQRLQTGNDRKFQIHFVPKEQHED